MRRTTRAHRGLVAVVLAVLFAAGPVSAANWYVDNAASGANTGSSWADAWTGFDQVIWGAGGVDTGDTLFISGGADSRTYVATQTGLLTVGAARVTIRVGQDAGHNGRVILDGNGLYDRLIVLASGSVVDGTVGGQRHLIVQNGPPNGVDPAVVDAFTAMDPTEGVRVKGIIVDGFASGIDLAYSQELANCTVRNIFSGVAVKVGNAAGSGYGWSQLHDCEIYPSISATTGAIALIPGPSIDVFDNRIEAATGLVRGNQQSIAIPIDYTYQEKSIRIFRNTFRNFPNATIRACGLSRLDIFNNVFRQDRPTNLASTPIVMCGYRLDSVNHLRISNNTIVDFFNGSAIRLETGGSQTYRDFEIRNNLIFNSGNASEPAIQIGNFSAESQVVVDSNLVSAGPNGSSVIKIGSYPHVQPNGTTEAPVFRSYAERTASNDFHLDATDTAARDRGADLGADFTDDFDQIPRPVGNAWDIGAYEYTGAVPAAPDAGAGGEADGGSSDADGGSTGSPAPELEVGACTSAPGGSLAALLGSLSLLGLALRRRR